MIDIETYALSTSIAANCTTIVNIGPGADQSVNTDSAMTS